MSFAAVVQKTWEEGLLFSVLLELTYRCNLNCFFCYNDVGLEGRPLEREQYLGLLDELAAMQVFQLVLTGGEPLAHPDFFAIGGRARDLGFVVRLKSNGHALRGQLARRLKEEVDPFVVEVSLHGADAATHDRQTRVPGSFRVLTTNLREMQDLGLRVKINSTLTRWNEDQVAAMLELARDLGVAIHIDPVVTPRDDGDTSPLSVAPSKEGVRRLLALQSSGAAPAGDGETVASDAGHLTVGREADEWMPAGQGKKHCGAGTGGVAVDPYGNVYPCVQWRRPVGNLHLASMAEIWSGSSQLDEVRADNEAVKRTIDGHGAWGKALNFCPGSAQVATGSPLGIYDAARTRADVAEEIGQQRRRDLLPVVD